MPVSVHRMVGSSVGISGLTTDHKIKIGVRECLYVFWFYLAL